MKKINIIILVLIALIFGIGCTDWAVTREKVQDPYLTPMAIIARNMVDTTICEGAPGDTMELHAYFSGVPVTDVKWEVSYNVYKDLYGGDTALDRSDLHDSLIIYGDDLDFSIDTDVRAIKVPIPKDIFYTSSSVDEAALAELGIDKYLFLTLIDTFKESDFDSLVNDPNTDSNTVKLINSVKTDFFKIVQAFTVPVRVYLTINGTFKVRTDFAVRFNRYYNNHPFFEKIYVNHNPEVNYMVLHKFKKDPYPDFTSDKFTDKDTSFVLYLRDSSDISHIPSKNIVFNDTVLIDSGYSYYVSVDSGYVAGKLQKDLATSLLEDSTGSDGSVSYETFYTQWYYEMDKDEMDLVPNYKDHMVINSSGNFMDNLYPPLDTRITKATLWVQVYDYFIGEMLRVSGNGLHEANVYFKYTERYKKNVAKN